MRRSITVPSGLQGAAPGMSGPSLEAVRKAANAIAEPPTRLGLAGSTPDGDRELLRHDASEVLGLDELERQRRLTAQQQARETQTAHQAALNEADEQEQLAQVMLALRHDRPVDDATLDQALSTFAAMDS